MCVYKFKYFLYFIYFLFNYEYYLLTSLSLSFTQRHTLISTRGGAKDGCFSSVLCNQLFSFFLFPNLLVQLQRVQRVQRGRQFQSCQYWNTIYDSLREQGPSYFKDVGHPTSLSHVHTHSKTHAHMHTHNREHSVQGEFT